MIIWKSSYNNLKESIDYIEKRKNNEITSLNTGWKQFNNLGYNGIESHSIYTISSRPGVGKTLISNTLGKNLILNNKKEKLYVLHFQFEMLGRNIAIRELSNYSQKNMKYIHSANGIISENDLNILKNYVDLQSERKEFIIDANLSVRQIMLTILNFFEIEMKSKGKLIVTIDHTLLVKRDKNERDKQQTLENLAVEMTELKNKLPVTFIVLSQLNRTIDDSERQRPGMLSNYPIDSDIYGSDYLQQCSDVMVAFNRPAKYNLAIYGPDKFILTSKDKFLLAAHILKNRFGELEIQWYKAVYEKMNIEETNMPLMKQ